MVILRQPFNEGNSMGEYRPRHRLTPVDPDRYWSEDRKALISLVEAREGERLKRVYDIPERKFWDTVWLSLTGFRLTLPLLILAVIVEVTWH